VSSVTGTKVKGKSHPGYREGEGEKRKKENFVSEGVHRRKKKGNGAKGRSKRNKRELRYDAEKKGGEA